MQELRLFIANQQLEYPDLAKDLQGLLDWTEMEVEDGAPEQHEIECCLSAVEDLLEEHQKI